ncbi:DUF3440 domain-containing protein [Listeria monocytogenes]|nr:DUF3440 domain-containing protein [Listeria monocytogenes]EAF1660269.1 DUF3440 domain-containing protein [Listeria monocytogenes]MCV80475.1 DUF3440 domain-containing protein [Listeria monocytogenes]MCV86757.1 DUF3440 domain-containing protein [Listeria monocytogenes]
MGKIYLEKNVLNAAEERLSFIFDEFEYVYFSVSGGKDSGVMIQLANRIAKEKGKQFDIFTLDIEAHYEATAQFISQMEQLSQVRDVYHFCLPFYEDNNTSVLQTQWLMWDEEEADKWVREMPSNAITLNNLDESLYKYFEQANGNPDKFMKLFPKWYKEKKQTDKIACGVGIRADESFNRFRAIAFGKALYLDKKYTTKLSEGVYNFYPIYDFSVEDIWGVTSQYDFQMNHIYELMWKNGTPLKDQRICQPYGFQQRQGLDQFAALEPETWRKVVNRVSGANLGNIYAKTSLLGHNGTEKPENMTWQEYTVFLLESLGLYAPLLRDHYYRKIKILMTYYKKNFDMNLEDMPDKAPSKKEQDEDERKWNNWQGIGKAIEKNDFAFSTRDYGLTKKDEEELYELHRKFGKVLGLEEKKQKAYKNLLNKWEE